MPLTLSWDEYFMGVSLLSALRSKDPNTRVGACIVNEARRIVGVGYNGFPRGCDDQSFPWNKEGDFVTTKYPYVVHAELNAILNSTSRLDHCSIYVSLFPCHECVKAIIQSGIKEIVYCDEKYKDTPSDIAAKKMLAAAGVTFRKIPMVQINVDKREGD